jgi:hypothetical protein
VVEEEKCREERPVTGDIIIIIIIIRRRRRRRRTMTDLRFSQWYF